jgi:hypothetical protein
MQPIDKKSILQNEGMPEPLTGPLMTIKPSTGLDNVWLAQYNPLILMSK